jgi:GntR family transcriptional regulator/MocR family aminotransferase
MDPARFESLLPALRIDPAGPLQRQLYEGLRTAILEGRIAAGARLPSTRRLAAELGLARITVGNAFDQLRAEGYLESRVGDGTYVTRTLPDELLAAPATGASSVRERAPQAPSGRGRLLLELHRQGIYQQPGLRPFQLDAPALDGFPVALWRRLEARHGGRGALAYGDPAGYLPLREAIAAHLQAHRGMRCGADRIIVTQGSRQALNLAAQVLADPGDAAWIEEPACPDARAAFRCAGVIQVPVRVDEQGLRVADGVGAAPEARLAYVCPSHQFPLGVTLGLARRLALLDWASRTGSWIIEDDFDGEYRYAGRPLASLHGLDRDDRVVYLGTFSRALFPGLRLGYLVVPAGLVEAFTAARALSDRGSPPAPQRILADFIAEGHFHRHLRRMRSLCEERRDALADALRRELGGLLTVRTPEAGLHLLAELTAGRDEALARRAGDAGLALVPLSPLYQGEPRRQGFVLGYAGFPPDRLREGVRRLAQAWTGVP